MDRIKLLGSIVPFTLLCLFMNGISTSVKSMDQSIDQFTENQIKDHPNDPLNVHIHTLKNGLKLYMSVQNSEPRISTNIAIRAGSKHDPASATGLAHYLEHMMFKGTSSLGSLDWEKEKPLLDSIADLYELHRQTIDPEKREKIYREIDQLSTQAAKYVAANEYDKMINSIGAKGTNAYTWVEQTVYVNDIPSNELEKWFQLESERFKEVVLRLFHTELEAVFEEYNINQDRDFRKTMKTIMENLFPTHPYGMQTTIGKGEHLKNPSHYEIYQYFSKYYIPNNMAIVLSGDFDPKQVIALAEKYFGSYTPKSLDTWTFEPQKELPKRIVKEVYGQESPYLDIAWKLNGARSKDALMIRLIKGILYNRQAGIIDLELNKKQQLIEGEAWSWIYEDYSVLGLSAKPRKDQSLSEVEDLLLGTIRDLHSGNFENWLIDAVIKDLKLNELKSEKSNASRVYKMTNAFILGIPWENIVTQYDNMETWTKKDIVDFAKKHLRTNNCVVVHKQQGDDPNVVQVEKPSITPIELIKDQQSAFAQEWMDQSSEDIEAQFLNFDQDLLYSNQFRDEIALNGIQNTNGYFNLLYVYEMGRNADKKMDLAIQYLPFLGTDQWTVEDLQKELFKLGLEFRSFNQNEKIYLSISGLEESLKEGIALVDQLLENAQPDDQALENLIQDIKTNRENDKSDKRKILRKALYSYAKYGSESPFTHILSNRELDEVSASELTDKIRTLNSTKHNIFFYGNLALDELAKIMEEHRSVPQNLIAPPENKHFEEKDTQGKKIFFVDFPMVQAEILFLSKGRPNFDLQEYILSEWYNNYFGFGLSSIVFQEIRESRALAYSAYAYKAKPSDLDKAHYLSAYVGTQADKMQEATLAMREILDEMPVIPNQMESAREAILKKIESDRITEASIYWTYLENKRLGHDGDLRKEVYNTLKNAKIEDLTQFHQSSVKGRNYDLLILADKSMIDLEFLRSQGELIELSMEEIFAY